MATKPTPPPQLRQPTKPGQGIVPRRALVRPARTSSFPLLPALAAACLLLGAAQLTFWWWESRLPKAPGTEAPAITTSRGNPFTAWTQRAADSDTGRVRQAQRLAVAALPQNIQFGDAMGGVVVTIFTDPSCGACREQVQAWTAGLPVQGVKQVYKFWPAERSRMTPGMLVELARRENMVGNIWHTIQGAGGKDLDDGTLLTMLDRAGLPLAQQRTALTDNGAELMMALEPDIAIAIEAKLPPPPVILVDDYVLDGEVLKPANLRLYVQRRLGGRQLFEKDDLWLMRK